MRSEAPRLPMPRQGPAHRLSRRPMPSPLSRARIAEIYARLAAQRPAPTTELAYTNSYTLLVAVTLSAQTTDVAVNRATAALFETVATPAQMVALGETALGEHIRTLGLWRNKARNVIALSAILVAEHDGTVPADRDVLMTLPGVGRKTADVVCNVAFGQETIAVDTHIFRVANRTGLARGRTADAVSDALLRVTPSPYRRDAHHWLILHGRHVCKARKPLCPDCALADICTYTDKTIASTPTKKTP